MKKPYIYIAIAMISILLSCKGQKNVAPSMTDHKLDMLQLDLADKMNPLHIQASFPSLGLRHICTIDKSKNVAVFYIDLTRTSLMDAIAFLDKEVGVESAGMTMGCDGVD